MKDGCITALKVVDGGTTSGWVGDARNACYTARLDLEAPMIALKAEFYVRPPKSIHAPLLTLSTQWCSIRTL